MLYADVSEHCPFRLLRPIDVKTEQCSETSEYKIQTPGNYPEESIQHSEQGESVKSRILHLFGEEVILHTYLPMKMEVFRNVGI